MPTERLTPARLREIAPYLTRWLASQVEWRQVPGAQVAVRLGDEVVLSEAFGTADEATGEELTTSHVFRIASHSKTFTAVAVLRLAEEGRLRLDDTVADHLPDYADTPLADATLRELLSHTSGAIRDGVDSDFWQLDRPFPDAEGLRAIVADHGAKYAPQEHFAYSNIGYGVLGQVIKRVTGRGYAEHVAETILAPLGLEDTSPEPDQDAARHARGHARPHGRHRSRVTIDDVSTGALAAATGFASTAEDLSRFFAAQRVGIASRAGADGAPPLLTDRSLRLMQRAESSFRRRGQQASYGLGLIHTMIDDHAFVGHSGGFPGHITRTLLDPESGLVVCVLTNAIDGPAEALATGIVRLVDLLARDGEDWQALPEGVTIDDLDRLTGRFHSLWSVVDVVRGGDRLVTLDPSAPSPLDDCEEMRLLDATTMRPKDADGFAGAGEDVPVELGPDGTAVRLRITGESHWTEEEYLARRGEAWTRR